MSVWGLFLTWRHHTASLLPSGSCCALCESCTYNHRIYSNGQRFSTPDQPCQVCACQVNMSLFKQTQHTPVHFQTHNTAFSSPQYGSVVCDRSPCPPLNCSNPYTPPGQCCPKCPGNESRWKWLALALRSFCSLAFQRLLLWKPCFCGRRGFSKPTECVWGMQVCERLDWMPANAVSPSSLQRSSVRAMLSKQL